LIELSIEEEKTNSNSIPHRKIINYLAEMFQVLRNKGKDIFLKLFIKIFKNVDHFAKDWNSFGSRFRICLLGLILSKSLNENESKLITSQINDCILNWYSIHPSYYNFKDSNNKDLIKEDLFILYEIVRLFIQEKENLSKEKKDNTK
jgi:agmatine/peptidylarginine deiminase